jgi:hypothetical protein
MYFGSFDKFHKVENKNSCLKGDLHLGRMVAANGVRFLKLCTGSLIRAAVLGLLTIVCKVVMKQSACDG